jgi:hypothetical protein
MEHLQLILELRRNSILAEGAAEGAVVQAVHRSVLLADLA